MGSKFRRQRVKVGPAVRIWRIGWLAPQAGDQEDKARCHLTYVERLGWKYKVNIYGNQQVALWELERHKHSYQNSEEI